MKYMQRIMNKWQIKKASFNHGWLKNEYINIIDGSLNLLCSDPVDEKRIRRFFFEDFLLWEEKRKDVKWLLNHYEAMSSHDRIFNVEPLINMNDQKKEFLKNLLKALWYRNNDIEKKIETLRQSINKIDKAFYNIKEYLGRIENRPLSKNSLKEIHEYLTFFLNDCRELGRILSSFPKDSLLS